MEFLAADPPDPMQAKSLEISILLILTSAVIDASGLWVLIKCYYLPLCPEAICWEWVGLHKSDLKFCVGSPLTLPMMSR